MTDYTFCSNCNKDFSLEQNDVIRFCPICGKDLQIYLTDEEENNFLESIQKYPQMRVDDLK